MLGFVLGLFVITPIVLLGGLWVSEKIDEHRQEVKNIEESNNRLKARYKDILGKSLTRENIKYNIIDFPQLTFEKWLTFYNTSPEKWEIDESQYNNRAYVPIYVEKKEHISRKGNKVLRSETVIPIYWKDEKEMKKYSDWVQTDYVSGNVKLYENRRDAQLEKLAACLQEDINERRQQLQEQYARVVDESVKINENISLTLESCPKEQQLPIISYKDSQQFGIIQNDNELEKLDVPIGFTVHALNTDKFFMRTENGWVQML